MGNYLYNGIELPALPEWDKETYPYAFITHLDLAVVDYPYTLHVYSGYRFATNDKGNWAIINVGAAKSCSTTASTNYDAWGNFTDKGDGELTPAVDCPVVWANFDVLNEDGTLYLAASDPIPVSTAPAPDPFWLTMGWLVGRMIAGMRGKREPVAYLYNGVRLPKLPVWDKSVYPYAVIYTYHGNSEAQNPIYRVVMSDTPFVIACRTNFMTGSKYDALTWDGNYIAEWKTAVMDDWGYDGSGTDGATFALDDATDAVIWVSSNLLYASDYSGDASLAGTLYLATSEPTPVYE